MIMVRASKLLPQPIEEDPALLPGAGGLDQVLHNKAEHSAAKMESECESLQRTVPCVGTYAGVRTRK